MRCLLIRSRCGIARVAANGGGAEDSLPPSLLPLLSEHSDKGKEFDYRLFTSNKLKSVCNR
ncbi:hypothetical protein PGS_00009250 [Porphyromonas gingivalis A7A1-28]|nr:hypothetical protein PGS_00009250 [Porphyromonas gingivalis A7A1-28]SJL32466.1 hypothetical protein PGIN_A7A1-28_01681 [Porphyromonas gingivalis]